MGRFFWVLRRTGSGEVFGGGVVIGGASLANTWPLIWGGELNWGRKGAAWFGGGVFEGQASFG